MAKVYVTYDKNDNVYGVYATEELAIEAISMYDLANVFDIYNLEGSEYLERESLKKDFAIAMACAPTRINNMYKADDVFRKNVNDICTLANTDSIGNFAIGAVSSIYNHVSLFNGLMERIITAEDPVTCKMVSEYLEKSQYGSKYIDVLKSVDNSHRNN